MRPARGTAVPAHGEAAAPRAIGGPPGAHGWWPLAVIASAHLMAVLDTTVMFVALPSAQRALGLSVSTRQWVLTAYTLALAGLLLLGGRLADRLGARRTLLIGVAGFALASAVGGASADGAMLIAARAGQFGSSIGAALLNTVAATAAAGYLAAHAGASTATGTVHGYAVALAWGAVLLLVAAIPISILVNAGAPATRRGARYPAAAAPQRG